MATVTFDTLELVSKLKAAGFPLEQAEAVIRVIADAQEDLVKKAQVDPFLESVMAPKRPMF